MDNSEAFLDCMDKWNKKSKLQGQGLYGQVFNVPVVSCLKNIPKNVKRVAIKIEPIKDYIDEFETPIRVKESIIISKKAAKLKIGPDFYDGFITFDKEGNAIIVKIIEYIQGHTWGNMKWKSDIQKQKAVQDLRDKINFMNSSGILHYDLHTENVMIRNTGEILIIDYDRAYQTKYAENSQISRFDTHIPNPWDTIQAASMNGVEYIYKKLLEEGSIQLSDTKAKAKANTNKKTKTRRNRKRI